MTIEAMILAAVVPFMTPHKNIRPANEVSTNFYGSVTGIVTKTYVEDLGIRGSGGSGNVESVNGKTGIVVIAASDLGAITSKQATNISEYVVSTNGFITKKNADESYLSLNGGTISGDITFKHGVQIEDEQSHNVLKSNNSKNYLGATNDILRIEGKDVIIDSDRKIEIQSTNISVKTDAHALSFNGTNLIQIIKDNSIGGLGNVESVNGKTGVVVISASDLGAITYEQDPTVGITNNTIYIHGSSIKPLTSFTEQDPTVPEWAKATNPPETSMPDNGVILTNNIVKTKSGVRIIASEIDNAVSSTNANASGTIGIEFQYGIGVPLKRWGSEYSRYAQISLESIASTSAEKLKNGSEYDTDAPYPRSLQFADRDNWNEKGGQLYLMEGITGDETIVNTNAWLSDIEKYVPTNRTVNGKALNENITLTASDLGAITTEQDPTIGLTNNTIYIHGQNKSFVSSNTFISVLSGYQRVINDFTTTNAVRDIISNTSVTNYGAVSVVIDATNTLMQIKANAFTNQIQIADENAEFILRINGIDNKYPMKKVGYNWVSEGAKIYINGFYVGCSYVYLCDLNSEQVVATLSSTDENYYEYYNEQVQVTYVFHYIPGQSILKYYPDIANSAMNDGSGNNITNTYATKDYVASTIVTNMGAASYADKKDELIKEIVYTWENFLDGSNVVFSITNYISGAYNLDTAKLRILEMRDGQYREIYNSHDEIDLHVNYFKTNDFRIATNKVIKSVNSAIANKADKAWGKYTSTGTEISTIGYTNTVYITEPTTIFAGGMEYQRFAVGEGSICILTDKGAPAYTQGDEGTFKMQDVDGTNYFGFAKSDSYSIGADASGISVSDHTVTITYDVTMSGVPCIWYISSLDNYNQNKWEQLNLSDGTVIEGASHSPSWEENPPEGKRICYINCPEAQGFFRATIEVEGSAKFITNMPAEFKSGIYATNETSNVMQIIEPYVQNGSVLWRVKP